MAWWTWICSAWAGEIEVVSTQASAVRLGDETLATVWGAAHYTVTGLDAGSYTLRVSRGDLTDSVPIDIPATGAARLEVSNRGAHAVAAPDPTAAVPTATTPAPSAPGALAGAGGAWATSDSPTLAFQSLDGKPYAVLLDGQRWGTFSPKRVVRLEGLTGRHAVEVRSADLTVVWAKGHVDLTTGDAVVLGLHESKVPTVEGRAEAWQP